MLNDTPINWTLADCVTALHLLADNLGLQADQLGDTATRQTATALGIERIIAANDKTETPAVHNYFLAVALTRNAIATRLDTDRDEAATAIRSTMREPSIMSDPAQARLLKHLEATLRSLTVW